MTVTATSRPAALDRVKVAPETDAAAIPAHVLTAVAAVVAVLPCNSGWFLADHTHENLGAGAYSLALEGDYEWPYGIADHIAAAGLTTPGAFLEPLTGWCLGIYPA